MCYNVHTQLKSQLKRAEHEGSKKDIEELQQLLIRFDEVFHASGFAHPQLLVYPNDSPFVPQVMSWGLIPKWVKSEQDKLKFWNNTLNCRSESMFEKPSFREAARNQRCLLYVQGFYEYHHHKGKKYPFYVHPTSEESFCLAGLWSEWVNRETAELEKSFTIVTTEGNTLLSQIHNNPKLSGPRMPVILTEERAEKWLDVNLSKVEVMELIESYSADQMEAYTVGKLQGKDYIGNVKEILNEVKYPELATENNTDSKTLFD